MAHQLSCALRRAPVWCLVTLMALGAPAAWAQTQYRPGFNVFTVEQDVEIGRQSAAQAERQLRLLNDRSVDAYLNDLVDRLAHHAPGARYPYQAKAVNATEVNAFALPGGYLYVNRGLIEAADDEGELAAVISHEMAHVALRHGTNQASKAYVAQAGIGILGGLIGGRDRQPSEVVSVLGGLGLNALFLKYSRDAETQADVVGAQMMAKAGYDPEDMAVFFDKLGRMRQREPGRLEQFFSSHPPPAGRAERIRQEARLIGPIRPSREVGGFAAVKADLGGRGAAPRSRTVLLDRTNGSEQGRRYPASLPDLRIEPPSSRLRTFEQRDGFFQIQYPENWSVLEASRGYGATIVPDGGLVRTPDGNQGVICGVIVNHYDPFDARRSSEEVSLTDATNDVVNQIVRANSHLEIVSRAPRRVSVDEAPGLAVTLAGRSPVTGDEERVTVYTRGLPDRHVLYALFITPGRERARVEDAFWRMVDSLHVEDEAIHR